MLHFSFYQKPLKNSGSKKTLPYNKRTTQYATSNTRPLKRNLSLHQLVDNELLKELYNAPTPNHTNTNTNTNTNNSNAHHILPPINTTTVSLLSPNTSLHSQPPTTTTTTATTTTATTPATLHNGYQSLNSLDLVSPLAHNYHTSAKTVIDLNESNNSTYETSRCSSSSSLNNPSESQPQPHKLSVKVHGIRKSAFA